MSLEIRVNARPALEQLARYGRQVPFVQSLALNRTAKDFQDRERRHLHRVFTLRRPTFVERTVKIARGDFATKTKPEVRIAIDPERDVLAKFEAGGRKQPQQSRQLAVPIAARPNPRAVVPRRFRIPQLRLHRAAGKTRGLHGTFVVRQVGIFRRVGRSRRSRVELLYAFKRDVPIPASLRFEAIARQTVAERWPLQLARAWEHAIRTAR